MALVLSCREVFLGWSEWNCGRGRSSVSGGGTAGVLRRPTPTQSQDASREHGWVESRDVDKWYCVGLYSFLETIVFALQWENPRETARLIAVP